MPESRTGRWRVWLMACLVVALASARADSLPHADEINAAMSAYTACGKRQVEAALVPSLEAAMAACEDKLDVYTGLMHELALGRQLSEGRAQAAAEAYAKLKERWSRKEATAYFVSQYEVWTGKR